MKDREAEKVGHKYTWTVDAGCNGLCCVTIKKQGVDPVHVLHRIWELAVRGNAVHKFVSKCKVNHRWLPCQVFPPLSLSVSLSRNSSQRCRSGL